MFKTAERIRKLCNDYLNKVDAPKLTDPFWKSLEKESKIITKKYNDFTMSFWEHCGDPKYTSKMLKIAQEFEDIDSLLEEIRDKMLCHYED